jgi:flagellar protein FlbT
MALKLLLKPAEKLVINGAVVANGDRRTSLIVHNKASILREKDIMKEEEVNSPGRHIYFPIMLMYIDDKEFNKYYDEFVFRMTEFLNVIETPGVIELCIQVSKDVMAKNYYKALINCKKILAFEQERLTDVTEGVSESTDNS